MLKRIILYERGRKRSQMDKCQLGKWFCKELFSTTDDRVPWVRSSKKVLPVTS